MVDHADSADAHRPWTPDVRATSWTDVAHGTDAADRATNGALRNMKPRHGAPLGNGLE
jgi:hypothetical protein